MKSQQTKKAAAASESPTKKNCDKQSPTNGPRYNLRHLGPIKDTIDAINADQKLAAVKNPGKRLAGHVDVTSNEPKKVKVIKKGGDFVNENLQTSVDMTVIVGVEGAWTFFASDKPS
eukprot:4445529-Ditylum_brightwellii.AAC.1